MCLILMKTPLHKTGKTGTRGQALRGSVGSPQNAGDTELFFKEIHNRAETITPVLKQILEHCPSSRGGMS
jgi:hypothetical protein